MEEDNEKPETNVKSTIDAVTGLVKAVPVYQDTLQPSAKQIGQSLETVTKTVNIALAPIKALVWGYEQIETFITSRVSEKLKNVPSENITTPKPEVAGPVVEALRFSGHDINLRELYANLLANAMDKSTIHLAHPGFVEILKNISSDEAILLQAFSTSNQYPLLDVRSKIIEGGSGFTVMFSNFSHLHKIVTVERPDLIPSYLDNLCRLGILDIPALTHITTPKIYEPLETDTDLDGLKSHIETVMKRKVELNQKMVKLTSFGNQFVQNVVREKQ